MSALPIIIGALCVIAIAYRYYSAFIAAKVLVLDDSRPVPSQTMYDGHNYYPTNKWVLFGHHFAALADEYYTSAVAYAPASADRVEPWEPNVTALLDPKNLKWKDLVSPGTPIPTPWNKEAFEAHSREIQKRRRQIRAQGRPEEEMDALFREQKEKESRMLAAEKYAGKVGEKVTLEQAYEMARNCALNHLAIIKAAIGDLDKVERIIKVLGYVNVAPGFQDMPKVVNGESDLLVQLWGERGQHARAAVGVASLSREAPVETEMMVQIRE